MPRGAKPGERRGGRQKGTPNKVTAELKQMAAELGKDGATPLSMMLEVMRDETKDLRLRLEAAKAAAPYMHARLSAVELTGSLRVSHEDALAELDE